MWPIKPVTSISGEESGNLLPPSPPAEKATARQDQSRQSRSRDWTGNGCYRLTTGDINCDRSAIVAARALPVDEPVISRHESRYGGTGEAIGIVFHQTSHRTE